MSIAAVYPSSEPYEDTALSATTKSTDATRLNFPLPLALTIAGSVLVAAAGVWRIEAKVGVIETAITYERELSRERATRQTERDNDYRNYIDQRFQTLESKIESAGLRNFNMQMAQELAKKEK